jgi:hypothetical protein
MKRITQIAQYLPCVMGRTLLLPWCEEWGKMTTLFTRVLTLRSAIKLYRLFKCNTNDIDLLSVRITGRGSQV